MRSYSPIARFADSIHLSESQNPEVDIMEVVAKCPRKSSPHVDGWRLKTLRALGSPCTLTSLAEAIVIT
jgi:hypothetical protein